MGDGDGVTLRLEYRDPAELAGNPANWRRHPPSQQRALKGVLAEVGWAGALLYNERTGRLIDGHLRKEIARPGEKVPVIIGAWSEEDERKILATLDPLSAMAQPDQDALLALLRDVQFQDQAVTDLLEAVANGERQPMPPLGELTNPSAEWDGMPDFEQDDQESWKCIKVHFANQDDLAAFATLIGQTVTEHTRSIWYPQAVIESYIDKRFIAREP